jgi:hypothetical protein
VTSLIKLEKTKCSSDIWKKCRSQLAEKALNLKKAKDVKLDWLPKKVSTLGQKAGNDEAGGEESGSPESGSPEGEKKEEL